MGIDLDLWGEDSQDALKLGFFNWIGRDLTWDDFSSLQSYMEQRITKMINENNESLLYKLAWLGTPLPQRPMIEREIAQLFKTANTWEFQRTGGPGHVYRKSKRKTNHAWKKTCEFCTDHKKEILIGVAVAAVVAAAAAIIISSGDTGAAVATAVGTATLGAIAGESDSNERPPLNTIYEDPISPSIAIKEEILSPFERIESQIPFSPPSTGLYELPSLKPQAAPVEELPIQKPFYPQPDPKQLYDEDYVADLYRRFNLPPPNEFPSPSIESNRTPTQQFVDLIQNKLAEVRAAEYPDQFQKGYGKNYHITLQAVNELFPKEDRLIPPSNNYASASPGQKQKQPFVDVPLLGHENQSTIHFHCGINNDFTSIVEGGLTLNNSLDGDFAIQPHLIHPNGLIKGLANVGLEKLDQFSQELNVAAGNALIAPMWPELILESSEIALSIDYEVATLSQIAQNIVEQSNPNLKQVHVTFSNGGYVFKEALKRLPPEYRDTIIVITTGTTALIENDLAHKVYNIIGDKDWPSIQCNGGLEAIKIAQARGISVRIIPQTEAEYFIGGHYCTQPEYQERVQETLIDDIGIKYEIH